MRGLAFTKMQGLGNDFVVIDGPSPLSAEEIVELCDRRFGVGADGVLMVSPTDPIRMQYWNADGSEAEMCGNGLRCVARYGYDEGWAGDRNFVVGTPAGERMVRVLEDGVEVELGAPRVSGHATIDGERYHLVDVGNPHAVAIVEDPDGVDVAVVGPRVSAEELFPRGSNVEFVSVADGRLRMRVWERGVGETLACGTGMVAAAFVATRTHRLDGPVVVDVPGGSGQVEFREGVAWLRGPADYVFRGSVGER